MNLSSISIHSWYVYDTVKAVIPEIFGPNLLRS